MSIILSGAPDSCTTTVVDGHLEKTFSQNLTCFRTNRGLGKWCSSILIWFWGKWLKAFAVGNTNRLPALITSTSNKRNCLLESKDKTCYPISKLFRLFAALNAAGKLVIINADISIVSTSPDVLQLSSNIKENASHWPFLTPMLPTYIPQLSGAFCLNAILVGA